VACPGLAIQAAEIREDRRPYRIQVEIPDQLQEVRFFVHHDGPIPVLEQVADPAVPAVEGPGVAREEAPDAAREGATPGADQEVGMVRKERPGVDGERPVLRQRGEAGDEVGPVGVVPEDDGSLDPPHHHVVEGGRSKIPGEGRNRRFRTQCGRHPSGLGGAWRGAL